MIITLLPRQEANTHLYLLDLMYFTFPYSPTRLHNTRQRYGLYLPPSDKNIKLLSFILTQIFILGRKSCSKKEKGSGTKNKWKKKKGDKKNKKTKVTMKKKLVIKKNCTFEFLHPLFPNRGLFVGIT